MSVIEGQFTVQGIAISYKRWGEGQPRKVLALHGWLDNAASFDFLAMHLSACDLVCLDLAGHGLSAHRPGAGAYAAWQDLPEIMAIADALGWQRFSLLGHSRGAAIALLCAGAFSERVEKLALIEGIFPIPRDSNQAPDQLAGAVEQQMQHARGEGKKRSVYASFERAAKAREKGLFPVSSAAALALAKRGVVPIEDAWQWAYDTKLFLDSDVRLTPPQITAFIERVTSPICLVLGDAGIYRDNETAQTLLLKYQTKILTHRLAGGHHLHMDDAVTETAAVINDYFGPL